MTEEKMIEETTVETAEEIVENTVIEENNVDTEAAAFAENLAETEDIDTEEEICAFDTLDINPEILRAVDELGFTEMTPIQKQAIPWLLEGKDVIGQAQTGTGKTAAFGIPILQMVDPDNKNVQALILCPTRELAIQAAEDLRDFAKYMHGVKCLPIYGGQDIMRQIQNLKGVQVVVGTPGRIMDHMRRSTIKLDHVSMVILDEADEMLDMGFREDMEVILGDVTHEHQTCLFSATMPQEILDLTNRFQKDPMLIKITQKELTVDSIKQYSYGVKHEYKTEALSRLLSYYRYKRCIIFCNTKAKVDELADTLTKAGYAAEGLHGDLTQKQRDSVMSRFRSGHLHILIATDIAARGIDVDDVEAVINYDIPMEAEYYVHRIGRTGRAGKEGVSHSLCRSRDFRKIHEIESIIHAKMEERKIPTVADIKGIQEQQVLEKVMACLNEGHSGNLIPLLKQYCEENGVTVEAFAAAALKLQMVEIPDDVDVDLPDRDREDKRSGNRRGRFGSREEFREARRKGFGRFGGREESGLSRRDRTMGKNARFVSSEEMGETIKPLFGQAAEFMKERKADKSFERKEEHKKDRSFEYKADRKKEKNFDHKDDRKKDRNFDRKNDKKFEQKSDRQKRREQSKRVMNKAVKDVRMNGKAFDKKRKRK